MNLSQIVTPLLAWYGTHARELPFRDDPTPYHVWLSEIMLQQTRVEAVLPYYRRFLAELPDVEALAKVPEERLLKLWEGLGYYNRARNLKRAAQMVVEQLGGVFPGDYQALRALPGIGDYTAGAIASIAFGVPVPAVDGNVLRVVSRLAAYRENIDLPQGKRDIREQVAAVIPPKRPGDFNQALMELGAVVCLPNGAPRCEECPLAELCQAREQGIAEDLPLRSEKKGRRSEEHTVFLLFAGNRLALRRRPKRGLLSGMWELPGVPGALDSGRAAACLEGWGFPSGELLPLSPAKHIFTHVEWLLTAYQAVLPESSPLPPGWVWASGEELQRVYSLPAAFRQWEPLK